MLDSVNLVIQKFMPIDFDSFPVNVTFYNISILEMLKDSQID